MSRRGGDPKRATFVPKPVEFMPRIIPKPTQEWGPWIYPGRKNWCSRCILTGGPDAVPREALPGGSCCETCASEERKLRMQLRASLTETGGT